MRALLLLLSCLVLVRPELPRTFDGIELLITSASNVVLGGDDWDNATAYGLIQPINARIIDGAIQLTDSTAAGTQAGAIWVVPRVYLAAFSVTFTYQATPNTDSRLRGLDGLAFVIQHEDPETAIGPAGGSIGYGEGLVDGKGILSGVAVELDTYKDPAPISDPDDNHIAVHVSPGPGEIVSAREPGIAIANGVTRLNDGNPHNVTVTYERGKMVVYYGDIIGPVLPNVSLDIESIVNDTTAWIGFTASTGNGGDGHIISYFTFAYLGVLTQSNSLVTGLSSAMTVAAGETVTFTLQARDQYDNPCLSDDSAPDVVVAEGIPVTYDWQYLGDGLFTVTFFVTKSGNWTLTPRLDGVSVSSASVAFTVNPAAVAPAHCSADGPGLSLAIATSVSNFSISLHDVYDNAFLADAGLTVTFSKGPQLITPIVTNNMDGTYDVGYSPVKMGNYSIAIRVNGPNGPRGIAGSPFSLSVEAGPVDASHCNSSGTALDGFTAGTPVWVAITARDIFNNIVPDTDPSIFTVSFTKGSSSVSVELQALADFKGTFNASFTATEAGTWSLQAVLPGDDSKDITGSPFSVVVGSDPTPSISLCNTSNIGAGLTGGAAGDVVMFGITARDVYSNLMTNEVYWSIAIVNLANTSITVPATTDFQSPGSYVISYSVEIAGDYSVTVQYQGESLAGSPWLTTFGPGPSSGLGTYAIGFPSHLSEKEPGNFMIQVADRYGNNQTNTNDNFAFTVTQKGSSNKTYNWPFAVTSSNRSDGFYYVVFGPADRRGTFLVNVRLVAPTLEYLKDSPYSVSVSWGLSALQIALIAMGIACAVALAMLAVYIYRKVVIPWRKRRKYEAILADSENRNPPVAPAQT